MMTTKKTDKAPASQRSTKKRTSQVESAPVSDVMAAAPSHDEIAARAYAIFQSRGGADGLYVQDWLQAESELSARARA